MIKASTNPPSPGKLAMLLAAPHRGLFAAGMAQGVLLMAWWLFDLGGRYGGWWTITGGNMPHSWWHALLLIYGLFPFFIFGFLLTAGPRWQQQPDTPPAIYRPVILLMAAGWLLADIGVHTPWLLPIGLLLALAGWLLGLSYLWRLVWGGANNGRKAGHNPGWPHSWLVAVSHSLGALGLLAFLALAAERAVAGQPDHLWLGPLAIALGLWAYLLPTFLIVLHRMLPFFSQSVIPGYQAGRPAWALGCLLAGSLGHGLLGVLELPGWSWIVDLPAAGAALYLSALWQLRASLVNRILAVLHIAFVWVGLGFGLLAANSLFILAGWPNLGLAPLHGLTIGFVSATLVGMASRVTLGHSGRPIVGDKVMWYCVWGMQLAAVLRIAAECWPLLQIAAVLVWLLAFVVWAWHYAPAYWRPRQDGQAG